MRRAPPLQGGWEREPSKRLRDWPPVPAPDTNQLWRDRLQRHAAAAPQGTPFAEIARRAGTEAEQDRTRLHAELDHLGNVLGGRARKAESVGAILGIVTLGTLGLSVFALMRRRPGAVAANEATK
jgi:hypothetical protein